MYQELKKIIHERRSIRRYTDRDVAKEDIIDIIDCARYAPSDTNAQTWEFIAICDGEKIKEIANLTKQELIKIANNAEKRGLAKEANMLVQSFGHFAIAFSNAPVLIICLATPYNSKFREKIFDPIGAIDNATWEIEAIKSSSMACQNIMLAAHAKGLATCPFTGPIMLAEESIRNYLELDSTKLINMLISLGYPDESPRTPTRKEIDKILTFC